MKKKYFKFLSFLVLFTMLYSVKLSAQQDAQYTQYMYNTVVINPAYAGNRGVLSVVGLHRSQWVGLDGAPRTQSLSINSPISSGRVGMGGTVVRDEIGPSEETTLSLDFSYTIPTSEQGKLSFGLKATGHLLNVNFDDLNYFGARTNDIRFQNNIDNKFSPNVGIGLFYHNQKFYASLSAPNILETRHFDASRINSRDSNSFLAEERINYYLTAGYVFDLSSEIKFKPAALAKVVDGAPLQIDVSANFLLYDKLTLGVAYRWDTAFSGLLGFNVSDGLMIGFAYDREITELGNTTIDDGSYEILVRFELFKNYSRIITPRFF